MRQTAHNLGKTGLRIGPLNLQGFGLLAPMSGITDVVMRRIARRFGASLVISEMVASDDYVRGDEESRIRAEGEGVSDHVVQIAGCDPYWMGEAAKMAEQAGAAIIDINMGCPAKRVTGGYAGSALMREPELALRLIAATVKAVSVPVTLKTRLGWDESSMNAPELALGAQNAGVQLVTIHGRTRCQFYKGRADWGAIRRVRDAIQVPLVANGDCVTPADAHAMRVASGADAVMIGRAALGRPWLVGEIAAGLAGTRWEAPTAGVRLDAAREHFTGLCELMGPQKGLRHARKHLAAYAIHARPAGGAADAADRLRLVSCDNPEEVRRLLASFFDELPAAEAA
jgi:nifR3 family TIM-barrel protein